jgi:hypothetical protein
VHHICRVRAGTGHVHEVRMDRTDRVGVCMAVDRARRDCSGLAEDGLRVARRWPWGSGLTHFVDVDPWLARAAPAIRVVGPVGAEIERFPVGIPSL